MAGALGGMFANQPPGPPPPGPPGGPGPAGLIPPPTGPRNPNNTLVDELEASFEACFASLVSQDYVNGTDQEEIRTENPIKLLLGKKMLSCAFNVSISASRNFWMLQGKQNAFFYKKDCSCRSRNQNK